jgi:two-component system nitrogen regulation sensor histidine kinase NtrY
MVSTAIKTEHAGSKKRRKRRSELLLACGAFLLIIVFSWVELKFFGLNSYLFLAVFNLNLILLLIILFLVVRNGVKLFFDRKRNISGSRLRTKLVFAFISLSLIPTVLMFIVAVKFVQTSVDYWFKSKVDSSMEQALEVGKTFYARTQSRLNQQSTFIIETIRGREYLWGAAGMDSYLQEKSQEYNLSLIGVVRPDLGEQNWHAAEEWRSYWPQVKQDVNWSGLKKNPRFWSKFISSEERDLVVGIHPVDKAETGFLVVGMTVGGGLLTKLDQIVQGIKEYQQLKTLKQPLKVAFYLVLGLMTLLIIFGAMWFGFRLAKEISAPVQALSLGTQRIAHGEVGVRVEDESEDELGLLVQSFNAMAEDLEHSQERLNRANEDLARQNLELEQRRKYMEVVLNNITSGVISLDTEDRISTVNKAAEKILGLQAESLVGRHPSELLPSETGTLLSNVLAGLKESASSQWQRQQDISLNSEERKLLMNAVRLGMKHGENIGMVMVFEDITELDKMQRMAAWREVARRIAHEIKNPLTPIKLSAQRLERKFSHVAVDDSYTECTRLIVRQVEHLQQMVKEFSSFAKLPEIQPQDNDLRPLLQEVISLFENSHATIDWQLDVPSDLPHFKFDRAAMRRVLINLLTNATEVLRSSQEAKVRLAVEHDSQAGMVRILVEDNGPGFNSNEQLRMFEPYYSKKKGNTGLGLTIVKSVINDHRGYVRVKPNQPAGSTFVVELPV